MNENFNNLTTHYDTTLPVVTGLIHDHYMGISSKDEMYSLIYKSNL